MTLTRADGTVTANWNAPNGATHYHVTYTTDNGQSWHAPVEGHTNITANSLTFKADNGKTYIVGVRAGNDGDQWSGWRNSDSIAPLNPPPATPSSVNVTRADGTLTASGYAVSNANRYHVTYSSNGGQSWSAAPCGNNCAGNSVTISGVDNSKTYIVGVRAGNSAGWSGWRNSDSIAPLNPPPATPSSVNVTRADGTLTASGYAVSNANKYHVTYSSNGGQSWSAASCSNNCTGNSVTISGVDNSKTYVVGVRAGNSAGWSGWRKSAAAPPLPAAPTNLSVTSGHGYLDITWDVVTEATTYDVRAKTAGSNSWHDVAGNVTVTSYRYTTDATTDYVAVRARNASGPGSWEEISRSPVNGWLTTVQSAGASAASAQAKSQLDAPASLTVTRDNYPYEEKLHVTWVAVPGASGYNVVCSDTNGWSWWHCGSVASGTTTTLTVDKDSRSNPARDLVWQRSYKIAVRAVTSLPSQASPWTNANEAHPAIQPTADILNPRKHPISYSRGAGSITLSWVSPLYAQGFEIDCDTFTSGQASAYTRCADVETSGVATGDTISSTISSWTVGNTTYTIDDNATYDIRVRTTNEWGHSPFTLAPLIYPNPSLSMSAIATSSATLNISNYTAQWWYKATSGPDATCKGPVAANSATEGLTGLTANTSYTYSAYGATGCASADLLATAAQFTTLSSVSNLTSAKSGPGDVSAGTRQAVAFTTGANSGGYTLKSITVPLKSDSAVARPDGDGFQIKLYRMAGTGQYSSTSAPPTTSLATLSGTTPTASTWAETTFTCSGSGCSLSANTVYFVVATFDGTGKYQWAFALTETQTAAPSNNGWDIEYGHYKEDLPTPREWNSWRDYNLAEILFSTD